MSGARSGRSLFGAAVLALVATTNVEAASIPVGEECGDGDRDD
jgi:hypothetical protein